MLSDPETLRFPYEKQLFQQLQRNSLLAVMLDSFSKNRNFNANKRHLLGNAVKITASLIPDLYGLYQKCLSQVGEHLQGDLYVQQQSDYNGGVYAVGKRFDIILSSAIIKDFKAEEIAFVIGHELGHVLFEHNHIPVKLILGENQQISYEIAKILLQWSRAAEISADRIGLLCSGSLSSAASVFFKTSSGLSLDRENEIINSLRSQYDEIAKLSAFSLSHEWICTHPLIPIRFKSLELICLDILSLRHQKKAVKASWNHIDKTIEDVLLNTEPLGVNKLNLSQEKISVLMLCLLYIAISDAEVNNYEESFIQEIKERIAPNLNLQEIIAYCKANQNKFKSEAIKEIDNLSFTREEAITILQVSYYLAISDNPISDSEMNALIEICQALGCEPWLVDSMINNF